MACLLAGSPTSSCPPLVRATTEGNIFPAAVGPSALGIMVGFPPIVTAAAEFVVPRSMPNTLSLFSLLIYASLLGTLELGIEDTFTMLGFSRFPLIR